MPGIHDSHHSMKWPQSSYVGNGSGHRALGLATAAFFTFACCLIHAESIADGWRSTLYPEDWQPPDERMDFYQDKIIQDFSYAGYMRGEKPLPSPEGPVFDVTAPDFGADPTGSIDSTISIQTAIDAAARAGGGVVYLPAGKYRLAPPDGRREALHINATGVVLRGAGRDQSFLINTATDMRNKCVIRVSGPQNGVWTADHPPGVAVTRNLRGPTRVIPVETVEPFAAGDRVLVRADVTEAWIAEHHEPGWSGHAATFQFCYPRRVLAVDREAKTVTLDAPTRYSLLKRENVRLHPAGPVIEQVGLEHFSIGNVQHPGDGWGNDSFNNQQHAAWQVHNSYLIHFTRAVENSWISSVASFRPEDNERNVHMLSNGIRIDQGRLITLEGVSMQHVQYGGNGGNGYSFRLHNAADNLITRSLASHNRHGFVFSGIASSGNVIHQSTDRRTRYAASHLPSGSGSDHHMWFSHSNLIDNCLADDSYFDARYRPFGSRVKHNITAAHSVFWNTRGEGDLAYVVRTQQARYGYAIGTRGTVTAVNTVGSMAQTDPIDHVEGVGRGDSLQPASLYLDQLQRRLALFPQETDSN